MSDMHNRTNFEYPYPTRKQVALYLRQAKTAGERKVWRDLLNSDAFHKVKNPHASKTDKKVSKVEETKPGKKKK